MIGHLITEGESKATKKTETVDGMAASYVLESNNALILFWIIALQCFIKHKKDNNAGECLIMKTI